MPGVTRCFFARDADHTSGATTTHFASLLLDPAVTLVRRQTYSRRDYHLYPSRGEYSPSFILEEQLTDPIEDGRPVVIRKSFVMRSRKTTRVNSEPARPVKRNRSSPVMNTRLKTRIYFALESPRARINVYNVVLR